MVSLFPAALPSLAPSLHLHPPSSLFFLSSSPLLPYFSVILFFSPPFGSTLQKNTKKLTSKPGNMGCGGPYVPHYIYIFFAFMFLIFFLFFFILLYFFNVFFIFFHFLFFFFVFFIFLMFCSKLKNNKIIII